MTQEQTQLLMLKGALTMAPKEEQDKIQELSDIVKGLRNAYTNDVYCVALALIALELAIEQKS